MADNDKVEHKFIDVYYGQKADAQSSRSNFTPGTTGSRQGDEIFQDFVVPVGTRAIEPNGSLGMERVRVVKLNRLTIADQELTSIPTNPEDTTQKNDGRKERDTGYDWAEGLT